MDKIKVAILNPTAISEAEKMMVCAARLTQRGHTSKTSPTSSLSMIKSTPRKRLRL